MTLDTLELEAAPQLAQAIGGLSLEEATRILRYNERLVSQAAVSEIVAGFTDDALVIFGDLPPMRGKQALEGFLTARFERQKEYRLKKTLRAISGNTVASTWVGEWLDARTGKRMLIRGAEFMTYTAGKCERWDAMVNIWEEGAAPSVPVL